MLCERCKMREASIQYTEIINGVKKEHNFCTQCAKEMDFGQYSSIFDGDFPLAKLLSGLLGEETDESQKDEYKQIVCPTCGTTYDEFVTNSRFGCPDCYEVFDLMIGDTIKQLQGSDSHKGKKPKYLSDKIPASLHEELEAEHEEPPVDDSVKERMDMIKDLKTKLSMAIKNEEFELAAKCRDELKALEQNTTGDNKDA